ncbi:MAG TPA: hypothetical protein VM347_25540 [Nonomuraea sp.]|nr:hypothetical protein [Nonomuraea sp.]
MTPDYVNIDAGGRHSSGRSFRSLADEYADFATRLRGGWGDEAPLPYEEFSGPYRELRRTLLDACDRLDGHLRHTGNGQVIMAEVNVAAEHINTMNVTPTGQARA